MSSIINALPQWNIVAGIIITLRYYRTWFYYHIMASTGWLAIVFFLCWYLAYCLPCLQFAFTMYMLIYSVCERMRAERSYCFIQVCSSVENMSICTIDSSDLNWKLLRSMHILRVLVVHFFIYCLLFRDVHVNEFYAIFNLHIKKCVCERWRSMRVLFFCCCLFKFRAFDCIRLPSTLSINSHTQGLSDLKFIRKWSVKTIHEYGSTNWWLGVWFRFIQLEDVSCERKKTFEKWDQF